MKIKRIKYLFVFAIVLVTLLIHFISASNVLNQVRGSKHQTSPVSKPVITLHAASGAAIEFKPRNGKTIEEAPSQSLNLPHLVLFRNSELTHPDERTLLVAVSRIEVPPPGVTVTLTIETQHGDPDQGGIEGSRFSVLHTLKWISNTEDITQMDVTVTFVHEFNAWVLSDQNSIPTPTDYFRYDILVMDNDHTIANPLHTFSDEYAFLMENQWVAQLPEVNEEKPGAAPDELVIYYCDMFPFQTRLADDSTRLRREQIHQFVQSELVPAMAEAFHTQSQRWGFIWYQTWTSFSPGDDPDKLNVALTDGRTWFHSKAASVGHAGISITVVATHTVHYGRTDYDRLVDKVMSVFQHELFHNLQRNIVQQHGGIGNVNGKDEAWQFFSEGTAVLASTVGKSDMNISQATEARDYMFKIYNFPVEDFDSSYAEIDFHHAALYWRFLYEKCGGIKNGVEDPKAGMSIIRQTLNFLYSKEIIDIDNTSDINAAMPAVMDQALEGSTCPFNMYQESLEAFAHAIDALHLGS